MYSIPLWPDSKAKYDKKTTIRHLKFAEAATGLQNLRIPHATPAAPQKILAIRSKLKHTKIPVKDKNTEEMKETYFTKRVKYLVNL